MRNLPIVLMGAVLAGCAPAAPRTAPAADAEWLARARELHRHIVTIDTHDDIEFDFATPAVDPLDANRQVTIEKMRAGGLDVAFFIVYVGQTPRTPANYDAAKAQAMTKFTAIHRMADTLYPNLIQLAYSSDDVVRIHDSGRLVAAIGIENGYVIGKDLTLIRKYFDLGARYMTLAHSQNNDICDSSTDTKGPEHGGLSPFGRQVVQEMNRVGMMIDISHVSKECMMQATALSTSPVIASHSATKALADHPRNLDDEQLRAIARNGGVAQIVALADFVKANSPEMEADIDSLNRAMGVTGVGRLASTTLSEDRRMEYERQFAVIAARYPAPTVVDFVNHIDHAIKVAGIDHVGISSDFDGGGGVSGWKDASETHNVTVELLRRGYTEEQIRKVWGGNTLRVWRENQRRANNIP